MTEAENTGLDPNANAPAASEPMIPKHRFDEIASRLKLREEELNYKNDLLNQARPSPQPEQGFNFEEQGIDPALGKVIVRLAKQIAAQEVKVASQGFQNTVAQIAGVAQEGKFLAVNGADKAAYVDRIKALQLQHWQTTGTALPMEVAYKLVAFDEMTKKQTRAPVAPAAQAAAPQVQAPAAPEVPTFPAASGTGPITQAPAPGAQKTFNDMDVAEMENFLNSQMKAASAVL